MLNMASQTMMAAQLPPANLSLSATRVNLLFFFHFPDTLGDLAELLLQRLGRLL